MADLTPEKKTRPARRKKASGWLDESAGGRAPAELRDEVLRTVEEATGLMRRILDGTFEEPIRDRNGSVVGTRPATIREITAAYRCLLGCALATRPEKAEGEAQRQAQAEAVARAEAMDSLDDAEFAALRRWAERLGGASDA